MRKHGDEEVILETQRRRLTETRRTSMTASASNRISAREVVPIASRCSDPSSTRVSEKVIIHHRGSVAIGSRRVSLNETMCGCSRAADGAAVVTSQQQQLQ